MTMKKRSLRRALPVTSVVWVVSLFLLAPGTPKAAVPGQTAGAPASAERGAGTRTSKKAKHPDLSLFTHSENCVACHNNLTTPAGEDVSIGSTWRSTMMANSSRDPYWQAAVRRETIDHPTHSAAIQDECAACHMPMTTRIERAAGGTGQVFAHLPIANGDDSEMHRLAADSISCTVCHQIAPDTQSEMRRRWAPFFETYGY